MTLRQTVRNKTTRALAVAALFLVALILLIAFASNAPWAWVSVPLMFGFIASLLYIIWLVDCPNCHSSFGQRHIFNVAFNLPSLGNSKICPNCGIDLDSSL